MATNKQAFEQNGYCIIAPFLCQSHKESLLDSLRHIQADASVKEKNGTVYGIRDLLHKVPSLRDFVRSKAVSDLVCELLGIPAKMVKATYFDKTKDTNWTVLWHQDCTIAVRAKAKVAGFEAWTVKSGINHVRPPAEYLRKYRKLCLKFQN